MTHLDTATFYCRACCIAHYVEDCLAGWVKDGDEKNRVGAIIALASLARDFELDIEIGPEIVAIMTSEGIPLVRETAIAGTA